VSSPPGRPSAGLSAAELAAVVGELQPLLPARLLDAVPLAEPAEADDLLLVLQRDGAELAGKTFLLLAPGGPRARLVPTARRYGKHEQRQGPLRDALQRELAGAELVAITATAGERRGELRLATPHGLRRLCFELFGARGLWALCDEPGTVLVLSRDVTTAVRSLRRGDRYAPPPAGETATVAPLRFATPVCAHIDAHFRALDDERLQRQQLEALQRLATRALVRAEQQLAGRERQVAAAAGIEALRADADLMLAYAHSVRRGADHMECPDPNTGEPRRIELDPARPVVVQAQALYERARRLDEGRAIAVERCAEAAAQVGALRPVVARLQALRPEDTDLAAALTALAGELRALGVALPTAPQQPKPAARPTTKTPPGENFRRYVSAEGYPILVGRDNEQNDRLTMRHARGNDLWLHIGGGRPGSHVVIRLPKQKTASLETLLDAAHLAVHFSKARGEPRMDVIYTHKKHVRKPKGLPAGAVVPSQTKNITVLMDAERLRRLLDSAGED